MMISTERMREKLRKACEKAGSQAAWARANGVSQVYVSDALSGRRDIGEAIAKALGYRPMTMYEELPRKKRKPSASSRTA